MKRLLPLSLAILSAQGLVHADEAKEELVIEISKSRTAEQQALLATPVRIIDRKLIEQHANQDVPSLLRDVAGIQVRNFSGIPGTAGTVDFRGYGAAASANLLVLVDGRRLNDVDLSGIDFALIPVDMIERIEIMPSGAAVLYGDGAGGGVINIVTRRARHTGGSVSAALGHLETRRLSAHGELADAGNSVLGYARSLETNGYRNNGELEQYQAGLEGRASLTNRQELFGRLDLKRERQNLPGARTVSPSQGIDELSQDRQGTTTPFDYADQDTANLHAGWQLDTDHVGQFTLDGGFRRKEQESFLSGSFLDTQLETLSLTPRWQSSAIVGTTRHNWLAGVDLYRSDYDSNRGAGAGLVPVHRLAIEQDSDAIYGQYGIQLESGVAASLGARTQKVTLKARDQLDSTAPGAAWESEAAPLHQRTREDSYSGGMSFKIGDHQKIYVTLERTVRFGTVDELFEYNAFFMREFSPLKPQRAHHASLGYRLDAATLRYEAELYGQRLRNEIHFNPQTFTNDNLDPTQRKGLRQELSWQVQPGLTLLANYAYTDAEFRAGPFDGNKVPVVARHTGLLGADVAFWQQWTLSSRLNYVGSKYFDNDESNDFGKKIPAYSQLDLKLGYTAGNLHAALGVQNVGDVKAHDYGARSTFTAGRHNAYPLPERRAMLEMQYKF